MIRTQIYLSELQRAFFKGEAQKFGIKFSEMLRRALDIYIKKEFDNEKASDGERGKLSSYRS